MHISVIIVNYRSADMVIDCINSVFDKTEGVDYEIIVVDNASNDGSVEKLEAAFGDRIRLIPSDENLGFGKANNLGAKYASGKYLFLLNPDTILVNNAIKILYDHLEADPNVGVAGGNLYAPDMSPAPSFCMKFDDLDGERKNAGWSCLLGGKVKTKLNARFGKSKEMSEFNHTSEVKKVAYIFGADMMLPRSLFESVNGFDPDFFMYAEEEELSWRITNKGYSIVSVPAAKIIHLEGATVKAQNEFSSRQFKMRMNGAMTYYKKRYGDEGVSEFYRLRSMRYERLIRIAKIQNKLTPEFTPAIQKKLLDEVYTDFIK